MHLYLHVPFCARRCSYCDFAIAVRREVPSRAYADAVLAEWRYWKEETDWLDRPLETIYLGGGTPSLLDPVQLDLVLSAIRESHPVAAGAEVTIEVNPDDVSPERARAWIRSGINRVSLGVQSFDPRVLAWMHRTHTVDDVPRAVAELRAAGITSLSLDLIFALPGHLGRDWSRDLDSAFALSPDHLSLYGLTVEDHTPLARWVARGDTSRSDDESYAREFLLADARLRAAGFDHYEVSNAARPGHRSRHNSAYWQRRSFIGLGPSAHSGRENERRWNIREWAAYHAAIEARAPVVAGHEWLDPAARRLEDLYLGLRTTGGISADLLVPGTAEAWELAGWAVRGGDRLRLTPEGWLRLDALAASAELAVPSPRA